MGNTIFLLIIAFFATTTASAQFYTITREVKPKKQQIEAIIETDETNDEKTIVEKGNNYEDEDSIPERKMSKSYASARKKHARKQKKEKKNKKRTKEVAGLPDLTIPNLIKEIRLNGLRHPEVVLAQAILETGWFTSSVCRNKNNLFGLTNPRTKDYYEFDHWTESVRAYYTKVQYRYKEGNYLLWLRDIGYAEAPDYIPAVIRVMRQLRKKWRQRECMTSPVAICKSTNKKSISCREVQ